MRKKKVLALLSIVAILGTSATAMAKKEVLDTGIWYHGKTSIFEGSKVYSEYVDWDHDWYSASVRNGKGKYDTDVQYDHDTYAEASVKTVFLGTDRAYYDFGNYR